MYHLCFAAQNRAVVHANSPVSSTPQSQEPLYVLFISGPNATSWSRTKKQSFSFRLAAVLLNPAKRRRRPSHPVICRWPTTLAPQLCCFLAAQRRHLRHITLSQLPPRPSALGLTSTSTEYSAAQAFGSGLSLCLDRYSHRSKLPLFCPAVRGIPSQTHLLLIDFYSFISFN